LVRLAESWAAVILPLQTGCIAGVGRGLLHEHKPFALIGRIRRRASDQRRGLAADLPTKKGPPPAPVVIAPWTWTGFYASLDGGYAWDGSIVYVGPWNKGFGDTGGFGGANVGYNYQIGSFVIGAQAGYDFADARGNASAYPYNVSAQIDGFGSIDGRAGVAFGQALIYAIGGWSMGDVRHTISPFSGYPNLPTRPGNRAGMPAAASPGCSRGTSPGLPSFANMIGARRVSPITIIRIMQSRRPSTSCVSV
jgi:hypothetical protein